MKTVIEKKIHILIILLLLVLSVFVMGINAGSIFADDGTEAGGGESTWLASGYLGNNEDVPWHVTSDWELIIGEEGNEYSYIQEEPVNPADFYFPWQLATVDADQGTPVDVRSHIRKVSFAGTVHLGGYCGKMFYNCAQLEEVDFSGLDSFGITDANAMFANCTGLEEIDFSGLNTSGIINMGSMFYGCSNLKGIDLSGLDLHNVTRINSLFCNCRMLKTVDLSAFSAAKLTTLQEAFSGCTSLQNVNLSGIDTSDVTRMDRMFYNCSALQSIDLSGLDTGSLMVQDEFHSSGSKDMFTGAALDEIALGSSTFPSDVGITQWITRVRTISGETVKGPSYDGIGAYDGSAPGWYKIGLGPDTQDDPGSGGDDPGTGSDPQGDEHGSDDGTQDEQGQVSQRKKVTALTLKKSKYDYTGKRIKPAVIVKAGTRKLRKGTDYTVKYSNNKAIGKARVTVTGKGRYKGKLSRTFRIIPDRVRIKAKSYRIVEGTQIIVSLSHKSKAAYYEFQIAKDRKFRKVIAGKKFAKKKLISGKIYAYKHLKKGRTFYIRIRLIRSGLKGRYSKTARIKGRG